MTIDPPAASSATVQGMEISARRFVPTPLAVLTIVAAAIILDPVITDTPFLASGSRAYFTICVLVGLGLFTWLYWVDGFDRRALPYHAAHTFLVTAAPALFLVGRIRGAWIVLFIVISLAAGLTASNSIDRRVHETSWMRWGMAILFTWLVVAGITSFQLPSRLGMPFAATAAVSGAVLLTWHANSLAISTSLLAVFAVIGGELKLALNYLQLDPLLSATIWLLGIVLTIATTTIMRMRVDR